MTEFSNTESSVFLRPTSGLVKAAGLWDVFIYDVGLISLGIGVAYTQRYGPAYYPGGSIVIATLLAAALMTLVTLGFWAWAITIPRSGGIYVFLTRAGFPGFGFALSFVECVSWLFYVAVAAKLITTVGLVPLAAVISGPDAATVHWLAGSLGQVVVATMVIWLAALLLINGTHTYLKLQRIVFAVAVIGTLSLLAATSSAASSLTFHTNFDRLYPHLGPDPYSQVILQARALGWTEATYTFRRSVPLLVWPFLPLIGCAFSIGIGGEIRNPRRNQLWGMLGSLVFCALVFVLIAVLGKNAVGNNFQGAIAFNFDHAASAGSVPNAIPFEPYFSYLAVLATNSMLVRLLIPVGFVCWVWFWIPGVLAYTERAFLAWALDRAAPAPLAALHPRFATPYAAVITGAAVAQLFLILIIYSDLFATLVFILAATVAWCTTLIFGIFFPNVTPKIFQESPIASLKVFGVHVMSLSCALGACALGFVAYLLWNDPIAAGHTPKSLVAIGVTFATGFTFYLCMKQYRKRQGIDLSRAYKEIPVE